MDPVHQCTIWWNSPEQTTASTACENSLLHHPICSTHDEVQNFSSIQQMHNTLNVDMLFLQTSSHMRFTCVHLNIRIRDGASSTAVTHRPCLHDTQHILPFAGPAGHLKTTLILVPHDATEDQPPPSPMHTPGRARSRGAAFSVDSASLVDPQH